MFTLWEPKLPPFAQKSLYGASGGAVGSGKNERMCGLAGLATSISETWLGLCVSHPPKGSELVSTIFLFGNGNTVCTARPRSYGGSNVISLTSLGFFMSLMSRMTNFFPYGR